MEFAPELTRAGRDVLDALNESGETLALAESCTGGLIGALLTEFSGSSRVFLGGVTAYSNPAKTKILGVEARAVESHGAVSAEVARQMAQGAQSRFGATFGLSVTGVAGPDGGTPEKPVGTVWCAVATPQGCDAERLDLTALAGHPGSRAAIRAETVHRALRLLRGAMSRDA